MRAYMDCLPNVALSGPTLLAPIIKTAAERAAFTGCRQEKQQYHILLILTDGVINDEEQTIAAIVDASFTSLSIIIIGILYIIGLFIISTYMTLFLLHFIIIIIITCILLYKLIYY